MELKSENIIAGAILLLFIIFFYATLGFTGLRTILGLIIISIPFYLILSTFNLEQSEKIIFSFFASIILFPSLVYWLGFLVSFKMSIFAVIILMLAIGLLLRFYFKRN